MTFLCDSRTPPSSFLRHYQRVQSESLKIQDLPIFESLGHGISGLQEGVAVCEADEQLYKEAIFALEQANRTEKAIALAGRARKSFPELRYFELWEALMLPVLYDTEEQIEHYRARYSAGLAELIGGYNLDDYRDHRAALDAIGHHLSFYLGYQGRDDRELQEQYARFVHAVMAANYPEWVQPLEMPALGSDRKSVV